MGKETLINYCRVLDETDCRLFEDLHSIYAVLPGTWTQSNKKHKTRRRME